MEGAAPHLADRPIRDERPGPAEHLGRGPAGEREQQDALGRHALVDEAGDAAREGPGLAGAGSGDHQKRAVAVQDGVALPVVEPGEPGWAIGFRVVEHMFVECRREIRVPRVRHVLFGATGPRWEERAYRTRRSNAARSSEWSA